MKFAAVVNAKAGAAARLGVAALRALMQEKLGDRLVSLRIVKPRALAAALDEAVAAKPEAILVLGGDGTARSAAARLYRTRLPAAFLPGGTMNILPKRLYGEMPLPAVLEALAAEQVRMVDLEAGLAGDEPFFVAASFGLLPLLAQLREQHRNAGTLIQAARGVARLIRFSPRLFTPHVRYRFQDGPPRRATALLVSLGSADILHPWRDPKVPLDRLECVSLDIESWRSLAGITVKALTQPDWRTDPRVEPFKASSLKILDAGQVRLTLDGEPARLTGPLALRIAPKGLCALALTETHATAD